MGVLDKQLLDILVDSHHVQSTQYVFFTGTMPNPYFYEAPPHLDFFQSLIQIQVSTNSN